MVEEVLIFKNFPVTTENKPPTERCVTLKVSISIKVSDGDRLEP